MKRIDVNTNPSFDETKLWGRPVQENDCTNLVTEDCVVYIDGSPQILYCKINFEPKELKNLVWACKNIRYEKGVRSGHYAIKSESATFGYMPRRALFQDFCYKGLKAKDDPRAEAIFQGMALRLEEQYRQFFPEVYEQHKSLALEKILPEWRMQGSIFSSGIANQNNQLPYHRDNGNFKGVYSNMIGIKKDIIGGHLICPEIDLKFEIADQSLLIFNGQQILHGVSPIIYASPQAFRYTVVYYTLEQMWQCLPIGQEVKRIRQKKQTREETRLGIIKALESGETDPDKLPISKEQRAMLKKRNNRAKTE